jgi:hypothetical protein
MAQTMTVTEVAYDLNLITDSLRTHCKRLGILDEFKIKFRNMDTRNLSPLANQEFAPRYGGLDANSNKGCTSSCPDYEQCKQRQFENLWPLCCLPTQMEVALAYRDGKIGFDHNVPEWLPEMVERIRINQW